MPLYEYECTACGRRTEVLQKYDDPPLAACPHCGGKVRRLLSAPAVQFKGTGWYVTDYGGKRGAGAAESSGGAAESSVVGKSEKSGKSDKASGAAAAGAAPKGSGKSE
jgi:putative FmdB family regulatory protein